MSFAFTAGAWAFAGLAAVLAIHLLRRRPRRETIATLFLLEKGVLASPGGRRLERVRQSLSLWLQLAAAALLGWLIMGPRLVRDETVQKIAIVLDSSASLGAFRDRAREALGRRVQRWQGRATRTEWLLLESTMWRAPLYLGRDWRALLDAAATDWDPRWPGHDLRPALERSREAVGSEGLVLLVTDHAAEVPSGVDRLAVGEPFDNVGFAGAGVDHDGSWKAIVKNHGQRAASRRWAVVAGGRTVPAGTLALVPGEVRVLSGRLPAGDAEITLTLDGDRFTLDDRLPLLAPRPKTLRIQVDPAAKDLPFVARFLATVDAVELGTPCGLAIVVARTGARPDTACPAIVLRADAGGARVAPAAAAGGAHPLVEDLDWSGLLVRESPALAPAGGDQALVWAGARPLILLAATPHGPQLVADFPFASSSAERLPAFPLLLHRFVEATRGGQVGHERIEVETGSELALAFRGRETVRLEADGEEPAEAAVLRSPLAPSFFRVHEGSEERVRGAAYFADASEADFTRASALDEDGQADGRTAARNRRDHPLVPWVTLLVAVLVTLDWALLARQAVR